MRKLHKGHGDLIANSHFYVMDVLSVTDTPSSRSDYSILPTLALQVRWGLIVPPHLGLPPKIEPCHPNRISRIPDPPQSAHRRLSSFSEWG